MKKFRSRIQRACVFAIAFLLSMSCPLSTPGLQSDSDALFPIYRNGLWGYSDRNGKVVVKPQFVMGYAFVNGMAEVWRKDNGQRQYIDTHGNIIEDRNFASNHFSEELIPVRIENKCGYADKQGKMIIFPQFEYAGDFSEGLAPVRSGGKWGYINHAGHFVIKQQFDEANSFSEGLALIRLSEKRLPTEGGYEDFTDFSKGTHDYGFINKAGEAIISPAYDSAGDFSNGLAPVCAGDFQQRKCGYVDTKGKVTIDLKFDKANSFSEGLASVKIGSKFGYIDTTGSVVITPIFETALDFQGGLAFAAVGKTSFRWGRRGVTVVTGAFHGKQGYIDKTGRFAFRPLSWDS